LVEIPENKKEIGRAREFGDLSENFEYKAAKERQDQLYQRTRMLEADIKKTQLINHGAIDTSRVEVGTKVTLKTAETGSMISYTILGRWDTDLGRNIISNEAPVAKALIGRGINDQVIINGQTCQIVEIEKGI
jgi:transcription elongation GreA/GreB family factor